MFVTQRFLSSYQRGRFYLKDIAYVFRQAGTVGDVKQVLQKSSSRVINYTCLVVTHSQKQNQWMEIDSQSASLIQDNPHRQTNGLMPRPPGQIRSGAISISPQTCNDCSFFSFQAASCVIHFHLISIMASGCGLDTTATAGSWQNICASQNTALWAEC